MREAMLTKDGPSFPAVRGLTLGTEGLGFDAYDDLRVNFSTHAGKIPRDSQMIHPRRNHSGTDKSPNWKGIANES